MLAKSFKNRENANTTGYEDPRVKRAQGCSTPGRNKESVKNTCPALINGSEEGKPASRQHCI
jgi:hypothetical protein